MITVNYNLVQRQRGRNSVRGDNEQEAAMFSYISPEQRVPADHPLRPIRQMTDEIFKQLSPRFDQLYARTGRPSIAPERLLRALLLQVLYSVRSERMLMEQLNYNLLFRWFVGLNMDDRVWDATTFSKNRDRLLRGEIAAEFFADLRERRVTPHVAQNDKRRGGSAIDGRTTRHPGYAVSQQKRKRVEEIFGWLKTVGLLRKTRHRGLELVGWIFQFATAAYNLVRIRNLSAVT